MFVYAGQWKSGLLRIGTPCSKLNVDMKGALGFQELFTKVDLLNSLELKLGRLP